MSQSEDIINIQILYDPNQPTELEYWSRIFQPVSLHGFLEYLLSDSNIELLNILKIKRLISTNPMKSLNLEI